MKKKVFLKDYTPAPWLVESIDLRVELDPADTRVVARMQCRARDAERQPLEFNGEHLDLIGVRMDGRQLASDDFVFDRHILRIASPPPTCTLEVETRINPAGNTALEGLYLSGDNFCTQCEAEGFRRITCFPDRPDVMAVFTTTVIGDRDKCPVLLSNGNLVEKGRLSGNRHFATFHDPYPKPCYLFALVAGRLVAKRDQFVTRSGRKVDLEIYVEERNRDRCGHAMASLKKAMRWDEEVYGFEYDLDCYRVVAVDDFNMGAMENKGLNIFNSKYVLARPEIATDRDYEAIEGVIAHEYFHNWTGNRITCRDWFQLSLKEGLTVFRDQQFSGDMGSRPVKRIHDVDVIRSYQFREDSGPMAHPVRPESFVEINNFYTLTVYNKGAEVIRMLHTLLGRAGFRRGMDLYVRRHDGQAVTCEDFIGAMADANGVDLEQFKRWYSQAGTPELSVTSTYDQDRQELRLKVRQHCPPTPDQQDKQPLLIPLAVGLLDRQGKDMAFTVADPGQQSGHPHVLLLSRAEEEFRLLGVRERPVLSFLRNFSAPVKLQFTQSRADLAFLAVHDSDLFNRWDAGQQLALDCLLEQIGRWQQGMEITVDAILGRAWKTLLDANQDDLALMAAAMTLPAENWIGQHMSVVDPEAIFQVRAFFKHHLASQLRASLLARYAALASRSPYRYEPEAMGRRYLRNRILSLLLAPDMDGRIDSAMLELGCRQYRESDNMTDTLAALTAVVNASRTAGDVLLDDFYGRWRHDPLVLDKWFALQAGCRLAGTLERVRRLTEHPDFSEKNPNKVRALISTFASLNHHQFHAPDGSGYFFLADWIIRLDPVNPQVAARLLTPLTLFGRYDTGRQHLMRCQLERIREQPHLSADVGEVVGRCLG